MGGTCSTHGRDETSHRFSSVSLKGDLDIGLDGRIILKYILRK
jgi:hypothetical protein